MFDYVAGKQDWLAFGLPVEGRAAQLPTIGQKADRDVPICCVTDDLKEIRKRLRGLEAPVCVVVNREKVVLGLLGKERWESAGDVPVEQAMEAGPPTFRPHVPVEETIERMREKKLKQVPVTTSDGRLVGLFGIDRD